MKNHISRKVAHSPMDYSTLSNKKLEQWCNWVGALGAIVPPSKKELPFLEEYKGEIILFALPYFNFCQFC